MTYNDKNIPEGGSLVKADFQKFMKRLRKKFKGIKIRYFHCGEYGEQLKRPHHHACIFNFDFRDKIRYKGEGDTTQYISETLFNLWPFGFHTIGRVTFDSAAYVARYITKKISGEMAEGHYGNKTPEYVTMSRRPGIGRDWIEKFKNDIYPNDKVVVRGKFPCKPPKYYDQIFDLHKSKDMFRIKCIRKRKSKESKENTSERLEAREKVIKLNHKKEKRRDYEAIVM